jgi:UDP-N-acetylmuramyl pentapeptide phosphotransferase/UDP-N-acetylglucosamine-1-phosphate transferase
VSRPTSRPASGLGRSVVLAGAGAVATRAALGALRSWPPGGAPAWTRTNYRGREVSLLAGPALAVAAAATAVAGAPEPATALAAATAVLGSAAVGRYDDVAGQRPEQRADKGFAGHARALAAGRVSAGLVKVAGVGAASLLAARIGGAGRVGRRPMDTVVAAGVIAGTANLVNLLDFRPGRALKAGLAFGVPLLAGRHGAVAAGPVGAAAALLPDDLAERVMLGDAGANALGAALGVRLAAGLGPRGRLVALAALVALTAASERVSFSRVIESTPGLRELDTLGRARVA